jgi:hypothetical protein
LSPSMTAVTFPTLIPGKRSTTCRDTMAPMTRTWRNSSDAPRK